MDGKGELAGKGDIGAQIRQVFRNLERCLAAAGAEFEQVVKLNIYATDLEARLPAVTKIRRAYFPREPAAGATGQVPRLVHPDWLVESEAVAVPG
jgi:enamine deaminase RidA (YjgF/YER057c/UK114 family)